MLPLRLFRSRAFSRRERRLAADVLRDVRLDLPARPVLPGRPGLQPARGRPPDAAVDAHAGLRRARRRPAVDPDRDPPAARPRHGPPGRRAGLDLARDRRRPSTTSSIVPRSSSPAPGWACSSPRSPTSSCPPSGPRRKARRRARTTRSASSVACSGSPSWPSVFAANGSYATRPGLTSTAWSRRCRSVRSWWRSVPSPRWPCRVAIAPSYSAARQAAAETASQGGREVPATS